MNNLGLSDSLIKSNKTWNKPGYCKFCNSSRCQSNRVLEIKKMKALL